MKKFVRRSVLWLERITRKWVVPSSVWKKLDDGCASTEIEPLLFEISKKWGFDPEYIRASLHLHRIKVTKHMVLKEND